MMDKKKFYINGEWVNPIKENNFDVGETLELDLDTDQLNIFDEKD